MTSLIRFGSRQYHVTLGTRLKVEKIDLAKGKTWTSDQVLAIQNTDQSFVFGTPLVSKAQIKARVVRHAKAKKIIILKKKRRKGYRRTQGHRQWFTELFVEALSDANGKWHTFEPVQKNKKQIAKVNESKLTNESTKKKLTT